MPPICHQGWIWGCNQIILGLSIDRYAVEKYLYYLCLNHYKMKKKLAWALVVLALFLIGCKDASITGGAVAVDKAIKEKADSAASCTDSDGGIDTASKGIVTVGSERFYDTCLNGLLLEYYCDGNNKANQNIRCPNKCDGGKCV